MQKSLKINQQELKIRPFKIPIFNRTVILLIGDQEAADNLINTVECTSIDDFECNGYVWQPRDDIYIFYPPNAELKVKCHEILHVCYKICKISGVDVADEEVMCYLFEYILEQCLDLETR